jgi:TnpA family transposase
MSWTFCRRRGEGRPIVTQQPTEDVALEFVETSTTADRCCARQQRLSRSDLDLVRTKRSDANRLGFAVLLLHFRKHGQFPRTDCQLERGLAPDVMAQLGIATASLGTIELTDRTAERHRAEIRTLLGFREATVADGEALTEWLRDHAVSDSRDIAELTSALEQQCWALKIEPPAADRIERIVRAALRAHDERFCNEIHSRLLPATRTRLDALLSPATTNPKLATSDDPDSHIPAVLMHVRSDPGGPSVNSLQTELAKLDLVRKLGLPADLFGHARSHEVERYSQRVAVEAPYELRRHADPFRLTALAAFAHLRGRSLTDGLVDLLIETIHRIGAHAERKVERELLDDLKRVTGKQNILFELADASLARPDGIVREVVFPVAGEQTLRDLVKEWKATGPAYRTTLRTVIRNSYSGHYRRMVPKVIQALEFRSNNEGHRPVIRALELLRRHADTKLRVFPADEDVPLDGVVSGLWRDAVIETDAQGRQRINRITYEICVLQALRVQLRCKEIWVVGANRYRNPDEDLPADFEVERVPYYAALKLPVEADRFIEAIKAEMRTELGVLDAGLPSNADVRLGERRGKSWITLTPLDAQPDPDNIVRIKAELQSKWSMTGLLDMVKESDLRLGITDAFKSPTSHESLDRSVLRPRLLLCLHGLGTNAGLQRMVSLGSGVTTRDLTYVRHRYISMPALREAITIVANGTLAARHPAIWGDGTNACASDSKHFGAWDQNLTTQWHVRYGGRGVMIYWHVERKSLCIHSQLKSPSSSEVASMIEGVLHHCTEMEVDRQYVDSHGQSTVGFAFCRLLGFQLLPRLKAIGSQRLSRPDTGQPDAYPNLQPVLTKPIDWELIRQQYDQTVKYATALRLGTAETEAILRRFTRNNVQHPTYKALSELGRAVKTIFLARYLHSLVLRREIHEGLNTIERWNGANDFVYFARRGEMTSNRREDHEISMLSLHLLQNCMVYVNTLMLQQVLAQPQWQGQLTATDLRALTPLTWEHVNPYGRFELDMTTRLPLQ